MYLINLMITNLIVCVEDRFSTCLPGGLTQLLALDTIKQSLNCYTNMLLSSDEIVGAQKFLLGRLSYIEEYSLKSKATTDPTRVKILLLLGKYKKLCPSDIARILRVTPSAISHQMRILENVGLVKKVRMGKMICYSLIC